MNVAANHADEFLVHIIVRFRSYERCKICRKDNLNFDKCRCGGKIFLPRPVDERRSHGLSFFLARVVIGIELVGHQKQTEHGKEDDDLENDNPKQSACKSRISKAIAINVDQTSGS